MKPHAILAGLLILGLGSMTAAAQDAASERPAQDCRLRRAAQLDLKSLQTGEVYVTMRINDHTVRMEVDTEGISNTIDTSLAIAMGMQPHHDSTPFRDPRYYDFDMGRYVISDSVDLGRLHGRAINFFLRPDGSLPSGVDGTLASGLLSAYDVEFDFRNGKLNLFSPDHCPGQVVYWTRSPYVRIPLSIGNDGRTRIAVSLDGKPGMATLDTEALSTSAYLDDVRAVFDWQTDPSNLELVHDYPKFGSREYRYRFKAMTFGGVAVSNPAVDLWSYGLDYAVHHDLDMTLGMNVLRQLHLYIAYKERYLYVTGADAH